MGVQTQRSAYPFSEVFEVQSQATTPITLIAITPGTIIENVLVRIKTPAAGGSANLKVGHTDDDDAFIAAADALAAAGTIYGDVTTERGADLYDATSKGGHVKHFGASGKNLTFVLTGTPTTNEGTYQVLVIGTRYDIG